MPSPAYLDASVVVAANVRTDRVYPRATRLLSELLVNRTKILVSVLTLTEALWVIAKLSYCEINNQRPGAHWNVGLFRTWCDRIFERFPTRMNAIQEMIRMWSEAGINVELVPSDKVELQEIIQNVPMYMRNLRMASADAAHLATAEIAAKSFVTTDSGFENVGTSAVTIFHLSSS